MLYKYEKREVVIPSKAPIDVPQKRKQISLNGSIAASFLVLGISLIAFSIYPYFSSTAKANVNKSVLSPSYKKANAITANAVATDYQSNVNRNFSQTNKVLNLNRWTYPEYSAIQGEMKLTIEKLKIKDIPIKLNVDSFKDEAYMPILEKSLAHFQGTSLPDKPGNTFIYGHSANEILARSNPNSPKYVFSFLGDLEIGDEILIKYNDKEFRYSMYKSRLVQPENIDPIFSTSDEQILTLMTCWTPGIGSERLIVLAKLISTK